MEHDVIIIGAGIVGSALAFRLGQQNRRVLLIERDFNEPDRIVGELMQPAGVDALHDMNLTSAFEGIDASMVYGYGVFKDGVGIQLPYPKGKTGRSFHHGRFVMNLRRAAANTKGVTLIQGTVTSLIEDSGSVLGVEYKDSNASQETIHSILRKTDDHSSPERKQSDDSNNTSSAITIIITTTTTTASAALQKVFAPLTIVCDGCNSNLRRNLITDKPSHSSSFVGLILRDCPLPYARHGHVFLANPSPILVYQIGSNEARILVDVPDPLPSASTGALSQHLRTVTAPQLPPALTKSFLDALDREPPRSMPNSRLHPEHHARPGVMMLGDAWNMRHPLTGGGMTVGLTDVKVLTDIFRPLSDFRNQYQVVKLVQTQFYRQRRGYSSTINILAGALYKVFSAADDPTLPAMRDGCLTYFRLGGPCQSGPVALLSGLSRSPLVLVAHFFAVAFVGVLRVLLPFPTPRKIVFSYRLLSAAANIVVPMIRKEHVLSWVPVLCRILRLVK